jgi:hypothetical protein
MPASRELHCQLNRIEPCLPRFAKKPPAGPGWIHEIKHDGFRIIAVRDGARVRLLTRKGIDLADASLRSPRRLRCCRCALASSTARRSRATRTAWPYSNSCATGGEITLLRFAHSIFSNWKVTTHAGRLLKNARARWRSCWVGRRTASLSASNRRNARTRCRCTCRSPCVSVPARRVDDPDVMHLLKIMLKTNGRCGVPQGRRPKSAKARNRGGKCTDGAAGSMGN